MLLIFSINFTQAKLNFGHHANTSIFLELKNAMAHYVFSPVQNKDDLSL
jgi:hypothetical protein